MLASIEWFRKYEVARSQEKGIGTMKLDGGKDKAKKYLVRWRRLAHQLIDPASLRREGGWSFPKS
jgi:hypothetical protein